MRALGLAALLVLLAAATWFALRGGEEPAPPTAPGEAPAERGPDRVPAGERVPARTESLPQMVPAPPAATEAPAPTPGPAPAVLLEVVDRATQQRIPLVRVTLRRSGQPREERIVQGDPMEVLLALREAATLRVEAHGYEPSLEEPVLLTEEAPRQRLRVELEPASRGAGIVFLARGPDGRPVPHVSVQCFAADADPARQALLWHRRSGDERGRYQLPDLRAGPYRFVLHALDAEGEVLTHRPAEHSLAYDGSQSVLQLLELQEGAQLELTVRDGNGMLLGPEVGARLLWPDGQARTTRWHQRGEGSSLTRADALPGPGPVRLLDAVPPGSYVLEVRRANTPPAQRVVTLQANAVEKVEVTL